jgi:hypothetical protein
MSSAILVGLGLGCFAVALCCAPFRVRFERFLEWIVAPVAVWFGVLSALFLVVLLRDSVANHEHAFLYAGLTLQLLGISAVARGISQKLSAFGKTGLRAWFAEWGRKFLAIFRPRRFDVSVHATGVASATGVGTVLGRSWTDPTSLQELAELLKREVSRLDREVKAFHEAITKEREERVEADEKDRKALEEQIGFPKSSCNSNPSGSASLLM